MRQDGARKGWLADWRVAVPVLVIIAALIAAPRAVGTFELFLLMRVMLLALFALGFNLLLGYTGLLSFGQAGFFAVGAYVCALILLEAPSLLLGIGGGVVAAALVALALGYLSVRLTEIYFAMLTLSFGMMIWSLVWRWRDVTGGDDGLTGIPRAPLELPGLSIDLSEIAAYYYFVLAVTLVAVWLMYRIVSSPLGLTFQAVRDSAVRAEFVGVPVRRFRLWAFVIAGIYAGLAGAMMAPLERTITPIYAHWIYSSEPVLASLIGGIYVFAGPIVGAVLFIGIKEVVVRATEHWMLVMGVIVIVIVLGFRGGVLGSILRWTEKDGTDEP
ncbi:MAG TPA: branched-chain amino acid ABC transporter permease [Afifellaceae bacterium]|nr:branched-chain amino acid ABC transporter permease [Afifellaceae bacterium]